MVEAADWDFVQLQLNYLDWDNQNAKAFYEVLEKKESPVLLWSLSEAAIWQL